MTVLVLELNDAGILAARALVLPSLVEGIVRAEIERSRDRVGEC